MSRILERIKSEQEARLNKEEEILNPLDPNIKRCQKGLHQFDRDKHKQCPQCRELSITASNVAVNLPPDKLYKKLWRVMCRDAAALDDRTRCGKVLQPAYAKQLLEYLKFLQEAKALEELERMEKNDGKETDSRREKAAKAVKNPTADDGKAS